MVINGVKSRYTVGGLWKQRKLQKGQRASRTPGKTKGLIPPIWARECAKNARAYKNHTMYSQWCRVCTGDKIKWSSSK